MERPPTSSPGSPASRPPAAADERLSAKLERLAREQRPSALSGRGWAVAVVLLLAAGGMIVKWIVGGTASPLADAVRQRYEGAPAPEPLPGAPQVPVAAPAPPAPAPTPAAPEPVPGPSDTPGTTLVAASATDLALAAQRAPAKQRAAARELALTALVEVAKQASHRREALEAAARLAGEAVPEEAPLWQGLRDGALAALQAPSDAGGAVLFLGQLFDRGGEAGQMALERVVDDERRPLELRVAAARALPPARRAPLATRIGSRANAHPALLTALR